MPAETQAAESIAYDDLARALDRCMKEHPPTAPEFVMHPDANQMSNLFARMLVEGFQSAPLESVKPGILDAYRRWT